MLADKRRNRSPEQPVQPSGAGWRLPDMGWFTDLEQRPNSMDYEFRQLATSDTGILKDLLRVFGDAFEDVETYQGAVPDDGYLKSLLARPHFIALVARLDDVVVGGLAAYELEKFERDRREIYIYDLAVAAEHRRKGIARGMIDRLKRIAADRGAYVIYVQADKGDVPAIRLYESCGTKEDVYHFDFVVSD
jgi:aminoglycoside 3-N-acetyltransferase I